MASNYAQRMARLSARIFGEVVRPIPKKTNRMFRLFRDRPYNMDPHVVDYYPPLREINSLVLRLRNHGLFRDEHLDFKEEMNRQRMLRGKTRPKKGQGKRAMKDK
ncbi:28S ribosomal protein S33, mitochondrial-like [Argonauta hians]